MHIIVLIPTLVNQARLQYRYFTLHVGGGGWLIIITGVILGIIAIVISGIIIHLVMGLSP